MQKPEKNLILMPPLAPAVKARYPHVIYNPPGNCSLSGTAGGWGDVKKSQTRLGNCN